MKFGDCVDYQIDPLDTAARLYVIGVAAFAPADVVVLANDECVGMPINKHWCRVVSNGHDEDCARWHSRYDERWPGKIFPNAENIPREAKTHI